MLITEEIWGLEEGMPQRREHAGKLTSAYTTGGLYVGTPEYARYLCAERGIKPELRTPESSICSIGFCEKEQKWYGWSHRAICGFGIGSKARRGDLHCTIEKDEWTAKTLADARKMACDFAKAVS